MVLSNKAAGRLGAGGAYLMVGMGIYALHGAGEDIAAAAVAYLAVVSLMVFGLMRLNRAGSTGRGA